MSDMSQHSFQNLFEAAVLDYEKQTGTRLAEHPLAMQLQNCDSIESTTAMLQQQAQIFGGFRDNTLKALKSSIDVLYKLSNTPIIGKVIDLVSSWFLDSNRLLQVVPASTIFTGIGVLLSVCPFFRS